MKQEEIEALMETVESFKSTIKKTSTSKKMPVVQMVFQMDNNQFYKAHCLVKRFLFFKFVRSVCISEIDHDEYLDFLIDNDIK